MIWLWIILAICFGYFLGVTRETAQRAYRAGFERGKEAVKYEQRKIYEQQYLCDSLPKKD